MNNPISRRLFGGGFAALSLATLMVAGGASSAQASSQLNVSKDASSTPAVASVEAPPRGCWVTYDRHGRFETLGLHGVWFGSGHWTVYTRSGRPEHYSSRDLTDTHRVPFWRHGDITAITGGTRHDDNCRPYRPHGHEWPISK